MLTLYAIHVVIWILILWAGFWCSVLISRIAWRRGVSKRDISLYHHIAQKISRKQSISKQLRDPLYSPKQIYDRDN